MMNKELSVIVVEVLDNYNSILSEFTIDLGKEKV